jgi:hypothetical protein
MGIQCRMSEQFKIHLIDGNSQRQVKLVGMRQHQREHFV